MTAAVKVLGQVGAVVRTAPANVPVSITVIRDCDGLAMRIQQPDGMFVVVGFAHDAVAHFLGSMLVDNCEPADPGPPPELH